MILTRTCLLLASLCCGSLLAQDHDPLVREAAAQYSNSFLEHWAFTETRTTSDVIRIATYDPTREEGDGWQLVSVNGEPPDEDEVSDFLEEKAARKVEREESKDDGGLLEMITPETLELVEENADGWRYTFQPRDDDDEEFMEHVSGQLWIPKTGQYLETIGMKSKRAFKPQTGVKIKEFSMQMKFGPATDSGPVVPLQMTSHVLGKAFLVAPIDENVMVEFTDYRQVR